MVGGGPGGSAAAATLASGGASVILVDREPFPRDKVCGDFVGPAGIVELKRWGITAQPDYKSSYLIREAALFLNGEELVRNDMPEVPGLPRHGRVIPRYVLDNWIYEGARAAGAKLVERTSFTGFELLPDGIRVHLQQDRKPLRLTSKLLIGADGSSSKVARELRGHAGRSEDRIVAVRAYYSGVNVVPGRAELYFGSSSFPGYYWFFPTSNRTANVGVGMVGETIPARSEHLRDLMLDLIEKDPALGARLAGARLEGPIRGWPLSTYNPAHAAANGRVLLVGDAAGLINPLNGEGIQYALQSGRWAAETVLDWLRKRHADLTELRQYDRRLKAELRYDMALAQMIVQLIRNRDLNPLWLASLRVITQRAKKDPEYARIAGGILAGLVPAHHAVGSRVVGGTVLEAIESLVVGAIASGLRPLKLAGLGVSAAGVGFRLAYDTAENPLRTLQWGSTVALSAFELSTQVMLNLARDDVGSSHEAPASHGYPAPQP